MSTERTRARYRRIPATIRRMPGGRSGGTGGGGQASSGVEALVGLSNITAGNFLSTAAGGGEPGVGTGFGVVALVYLRAVPNATAHVFQRIRSGGPTYDGYQVYFQNTALVGIAFCNGTATVPGIEWRKMLASDVGRLHLIIGRVLPTPGNIEIFVDGEVGPVTGPLTSYVAATVAAVVGGPSALTYADVLAAMTFRGTPTNAQLTALANVIRTRGDVPDTMDGATITHRHSLRDELRGTIVVDGQLAPAQLTDTVTRAPVDALARQGSPVVRVIDAAIEGRRTLGAMGFSESNYFVAQTAGIRGAASGFTVILLARLDAPASAVSGRPVINNYSAVSTGYNLYGFNGRWSVFAYGGASMGFGPTFTASDNGRHVVVALTWDGTTWQGYVDGVLGGTAAAGFAFSTTSPMFVGRGMAPGGQVNDFCSVLAIAGCDQALTPAELQTVQATWQATGRLVLPTGKLNPHHYDLTLDTLASGVDAVPAVVLDRVGTDHLTRFGIDVQTGPNGIKGVGPYSVGDGWQSAPGGGIQGAVGGFHVLADWAVPAVMPAAAFSFAGDAPPVATNAWRLFGPTATTLQFALIIGGTAKLSATYTIAGADLGKRLRVIGQLTATGNLQLWVNGVQAGADVAAGAAYVVPGATAIFEVGRYQAVQPCPGSIELVQGGSFPLTPAEIATLNADLTAAPPLVRTQKRYVFGQDVAAAGGALPTRSVERISGNDDLLRMGSPLALAQRTERLWSYEDKPIANGFLMPTAASDAFEAAGVQIGNTTGSWWLTVITQQLGTAAGSKRFVHKSTGTAGFLGFTLNGANYQTQAANGAVMTTCGVAVIAAGDVGKIAVLSIMWDATQQKMRVFYKRAEIGGGTAFASGYTPDTGNLCWGAIRAGGGSPQDNANQLGMCGGNGLLNPAELYAQHDAILAFDGVIQAVPGKTSHLWNGRRLAGVSTFTPGVTTIPDEIGGSPMVLSNIIGSAAMTRADIYARAFVV